MASSARRQAGQQSINQAAAHFASPGQKKTAAGQQQVAQVGSLFSPTKAGPIQPSPGQVLGGKLTRPLSAVSRGAAAANQRVGNWGSRNNIGGPTGRVNAWQQGYENALAYTQPGARGLLAAISGSFGGEVDDDTRQIVNLRQAGLGQNPRQPSIRPLGGRL